MRQLENTGILSKQLQVTKKINSRIRCSASRHRLRLLGKKRKQRRKQKPNKLS